MALPIGALLSLGSGLLGAASSSKASKQQDKALKQQAAFQQQGVQAFSPYAKTGGYANQALQDWMGLGSNDSYEDIYEANKHKFAIYKKKKKKGGLGGAVKGAISGSIGGAGSSVMGGISGYKGGKGMKFVGYDENKLKDYVTKEMEKQKARRSAPGFGEGMREFKGDDLQDEAGYKWRLKQGEQSTQAGQAARGGLFSGAAGKELARYGQGFASNEFGKAYDRFQTNRNTKYNMLSGQQNVGMNAAGRTAGQLNLLGQTAATRGANKASGTMGAANALAGGAGGAFNYWQQKSQMGK